MRAIILRSKLQNVGKKLANFLYCLLQISFWRSLLISKMRAAIATTAAPERL